MIPFNLMSTAQRTHNIEAVLFVEYTRTEKVGFRNVGRPQVRTYKCSGTILLCYLRGWKHVLSDIFVSLQMNKSECRRRRL